MAWATNAACFYAIYLWWPRRGVSDKRRRQLRFRRRLLRASGQQGITGLALLATLLITYWSSPDDPHCQFAYCLSQLSLQSCMNCLQPLYFQRSEQRPWHQRARFANWTIMQGLVLLLAIDTIRFERSGINIFLLVWNMIWFIYA